MLATLNGAAMFSWADTNRSNVIWCIYIYRPGLFCFGVACTVFGREPIIGVFYYFCMMLGLVLFWAWLPLSGMHVEASRGEISELYSDTWMTAIGPAFSLLRMQPARQMEAEMLQATASPNPARNIMFTWSCWESRGSCCDSVYMNHLQTACIIFGLKQSQCCKTELNFLFYKSAVWDHVVWTSVVFGIVVIPWAW